MVGPSTFSPPALQGPPGQRFLATACGLLGLFSVGPLLAWVYGLGPFALWVWLGAVPGLAFIAITGLILRRTGRWPALRVALVAGALGGLAGTAGYDLFRAPFVAAGFRLYAPINSYGILILGATHSSALSDTLGWLYNFANGLGFGVAYAMLGLGRRWWWAIPFAMLLETTTVVTPYSGMYGLTGHPEIIALAYAAHVVYGAALGLVVQRAAGWSPAPDALPPLSWALAVVVLGVVLLQRPWVVKPEPAAVGGRPAALIEAGRFEPQWTRVPTGGCVVLLNRDEVPRQPGRPAGAAPIPAGAAATLCYRQPGVQRVQLDGVPYSGGWVLVDPAMR